MVTGNKVSQGECDCLVLTLLLSPQKIQGQPVTCPQSSSYSAWHVSRGERKGDHPLLPCLTLYEDNWSTLLLEGD